MRDVLAFTSIVLILCVNSAFAQTASDLHAKYGKPVSAYSVGEHIWMSSEYAKDGRVCKMWVYSKRFAGDTSYVGTQLPFDELKIVLNQLVPVETRGSKKDSFGMTATGGGAAWTTYSYENVTFVFVSPFKVGGGTVIKPYQVSDQVVSPSRKTESRTTPDDDFIPSQVFPTQMVTIRWNDRTCDSK